MEKAISVAAVNRKIARRSGGAVQLPYSCQTCEYASQVIAAVSVYEPLRRTKKVSVVCVTELGIYGVGSSQRNRSSCSKFTSEVEFLVLDCAIVTLRLPSLLM